MTADDWEAQMMAEMTYLDGQVRALLLNKKIMRKYTLTEYWCRDCGQTILRVLDTRPWPVVTFRNGTKPPDGNPRMMRRADDWDFVPVVERDPHMFIAPLCWCSHWGIRIDELLDDMGAGNRRRAMTSPYRD